ncbi:MAG: acyl-CoA dehydrogenase family protein, partial [Acidobacteriota bacterium]|nr:acyl-CoA dehydrogenase family protein [Acidobacteriota bacterium]
GLLALPVPAGSGGADADWWTWFRVLREVARGCGSTGNALNMHTVVLRFVRALSTRELQEEIFDAVATEGALVATLTNEPQMSLRSQFDIATRVIESGDKLVVTGKKHFCSLATAARWYHVMASDPSRTDVERFRTLLVPSDLPGITVHDDWDVMAMRATASNSITFEEVEVPAHYETAPPGGLQRSRMQEYFTPGYAAIYLGVADAAYRFTADYVLNTRFTGDELPIAHRPAAQRAIAEMATGIEASEALLERAARAAEVKSAKECAQAFQMAKYVACSTAREVATLALDVCGARALQKRYPLERYIRDAQAGHLMQPTADICRSQIGRRALGLDPFEPGRTVSRSSD